MHPEQIGFLGGHFSVRLPDYQFKEQKMVVPMARLYLAENI